MTSDTERNLAKSATRKSVVITGGSKKGLALTCAKKLLARGDRVFLLSRTPGETAPLREQYGGLAKWVRTDLTERSSIIDAFRHIAAHSERVDALVISATYAEAHRFEDLPEHAVDTSLAMNIAGSIYCLQQAAPIMEGGRCVYISSESVSRPVFMLSLYAAAKAAMETMLDGIRKELYEQRRIQLTTLRSGSMQETSFSAAWSDEMKEEFYTLVREQGTAIHTGSVMPIDRVASALLFALDLPSDCATHHIDLRSADAF